MLDMISITVCYYLEEWNRKFDCWKQYELRNVTHKTFNDFFKVGYRCDGITVNYGLEVSSQPIATRIQVGGSRMSNCRKLPADYSFVTEMAAVHLFYTKRQYDMHRHRSTIRFIFRVIRYNVTSGKAMWYNHSIYAVWCSSTHQFDDGRIISRQFPTVRLLDLPTWILANCSCGHTSRTWSTGIPSHLHPTLKKV